MTISFNTTLLDFHLAPGISQFTTCDAPDISEIHPEATHWIANHFLNSSLGTTYKNKFRQYAINQIFRAQVAFADYHEARSLTIEYLNKGNPDNPALRYYFRAIARWESCLLNLQIFIDVMNKMKKDFGDEEVFESGDKTPEERAYLMANTVKHFGSDVAAERHAIEDTIPLWLVNSSLKTRTHEISFKELAKLVSEVASVADEMQDPKSFANPKQN